MIKRIKKTGQPDWEMKRFCIPAVLYADCPECGDTCEWDGDEDYILYGGPGVNRVHFLCHHGDDECHDWEEEVLVEINVKKVKAVDGGPV